MAEAVAAIGLIASIASLVDIGARCMSKLKESENGTKSRPNHFHDVQHQLPLLIDMVEEIKANAKSNTLATSTEQNLSTAVEGCTRQIEKITKLVDKFVILTGDSSLTRARKAFGSVKSENRLLQAIQSLETYKSTLQMHASVMPRCAPPLVEASRLFHVPSRRVAKFVGRSELLTRLSQDIEPPQSLVGDSKVAILLAMGGQGKTQIALEYCRQCFNEAAFHNVLWLDASSENMLIRSYCALGDAMSVDTGAFADESSKARLVKSAVEKLEGSCLFVFDNFDRPDIFQNIRDYFPTRSEISFLFTSRHLEAERLGSVINVPPMMEEESVTLLLQRAQIGRDEQSVETAKIITQKLGHHPLALDQAGSYIYFRKLPLTVFLQRFNQRKREVLNYTPALWEYRRAFDKLDTESALSACTTFEMSLDQATENNPIVVELLSISAFMNSTSIDEETLQQAPDPACLKFFTKDGTCDTWDSYKFADVITSLCTVSLVETVTLVGRGLVYSLHPLIRDWLRIRLTENEIEATARKVIELLTSTVDALTDLYIDFHVRSSIAAHMDAYLDAEKEISDLSSGIYDYDHCACVFGSVYNAHGRFQDAVDVFQKLLRRQQARGRDASSTKLNMANAVRNLARFEEAADLYTSVYEERKKTFPPDAVEVSRALEGLAFVHSASGKLAQADGEFRSLLEQREKHPTKLIISTSRVVEGIASIRRVQGRLLEAEALFARALTTRVKNIGAARMETMRALEGLAIVYRNQGRLAEALHLYGYTLRFVKMQVGTEHSRYGRALYNKALALLHQKQLSEAEPIAVQAHQCLLACFGPEDAHVKQAAKLIEEVDFFRPSSIETSLHRRANTQMFIEPDMEEVHNAEIRSDEIMTLARLDGFPPSYLDDTLIRSHLTHYERKSDTAAHEHYDPHTSLYDGHVIHGTPIEVYKAAGADLGSMIDSLKAWYNLGPDMRDSKGLTALARAARDGHTDVITLLLDRDDVKADQADKQGLTPLMYAAMRGHFDAVKLLLQKYDRAMVAIRARTGLTAANHAEMIGYSEIAEYIKAHADMALDTTDTRKAASTEATNADRPIQFANLDLQDRADTDPVTLEALDWTSRAEVETPVVALEATWRNTKMLPTPMSIHDRVAGS